jgi:hypothetical protein
MADSMSELLDLEEENTPTPCLTNPQNLNWIFSERGQAFFRKVLNTVGLAESETMESRAARAIFSHAKKTQKSIDVAVEFLKEISTCFQVCYQNIQDIKCLNKKMVHLERSFETLRDNLSIKNKWCLLLNSCGLQVSDATNIVLNHVLQHFWSSVVLENSGELDENSATIDLSTTSAGSAACSSTASLESTQCVDELENIEAKSIQEHAGWVCKRVRDLFKDGPEVHKIQLSKTNNVQIEVDKHFILSLIQRLGHDALVQPGRFLFIPIPDVLEVFVYLHNMIEQIVKDRLETCADKDILKTCLKFLSKDPNLRKLWQKLLGNEDNDNFRAGSVVLLQRVVGMFLKSKQQIIREQLQLKANKQSSSLRQTITKSQKAKKNPSEPVECLVAFRGNPTDASTVVAFLTAVFMKSEPSVILGKLHGNELTTILQSLGLPGLNGKGKNRQIELLVNHHVSGKDWNIVFPDKVSH